MRAILTNAGHQSKVCDASGRVGNQKKSGLTAVHWGKLCLPLLHSTADSCDLGMGREMSSMAVAVHSKNPKETQPLHVYYSWMSSELERSNKPRVTAQGMEIDDHPPKVVSTHAVTMSMS